MKEVEIFFSCGYGVQDKTEQWWPNTLEGFKLLLGKLKTAHFTGLLIGFGWLFPNGQAKQDFLDELNESGLKVLLDTSTVRVYSDAEIKANSEKIGKSITKLKNFYGLQIANEAKFRNYSTWSTGIKTFRKQFPKQKLSLGLSHRPCHRIVPSTTNGKLFKDNQLIIGTNFRAPKQGLGDFGCIEISKKNIKICAEYSSNAYYVQFYYYKRFVDDNEFDKSIKSLIKKIEDTENSVIVQWLGTKDIKTLFCGSTDTTVQKAEVFIEETNKILNKLTINN